MRNLKLDDKARVKGNKYLKKILGCFDEKYLTQVNLNRPQPRENIGTLCGRTCKLLLIQNLTCHSQSQCFSTFWVQVPGDDEIFILLSRSQFFSPSNKCF